MVEEKKIGPYFLTTGFDGFMFATISFYYMVQVQLPKLEEKCDLILHMQYLTNP